LSPRLAAVLLSLAIIGTAAAAPAYTLRGDWEQGSVIIGQTQPGSTVTLDQQKLDVSPTGLFVFAFDRDATGTAQLKVTPRIGPANVERHEIAKHEWLIENVDGLPPKFVNPPPETQARIDAESKRIAASKRRDSPNTDFAVPFIWPATGRISGVFGSQRILNGEPKSPHYGVDVAVPEGTPVHAPAGGTVSLADPDLYYTGGTVIIDHGHGLQSILVHQSKLLVQTGDVVKQGDVIGLSGMTGRATGPHLHWGLYWFDAHVDAQKFVGPMPVAETPVGPN
jgi:murein DD-endopeptidase MepM/ murein hydrolase activator NlpD